MLPIKKANTLVEPDELKERLDELSKGSLDLKLNEVGNISAVFGRRNVSVNDLHANFMFLVDLLNSKKPQGMKMKFIKTAYISTSQGSSYKIKIKSIYPKKL